jgi:hypothetical protein
MTIRPFLHFPPPPSDPESRRQYEVLQQIRKGKTENVGEVTLTASAASTTVTDIRVSPQSCIVWHPRTANAAAEIKNGTMYVTDANMGNGTFTITHANNVQTDRDFRYAVIG